MNDSLKLPGKKSVHVFASDFLPFPGCPRTAGSNRSMQVISALRNAGHKVSVSIPLSAHLSKKYGDKLLPHLSKEDLWSSEHFFEPETVLNRLQPDAVVYCNVNCFQTMKRFSKDIVQVIDLYGPLQFEGLLLDATDYDAAKRDASALESRCREMVEKFRYVDYLITVSERQKYFWSAYCSMAGFSFSELNVLVCPVYFAVPDVQRKTASNLTVVYSGGFYPWQNPERSLRAAAEILDGIDGAVLHIYGGPHAGLPNESDVYAMLKELEKYKCVKYHGYRPVEELAETLSTAWCALELMEQNIERELAITGRTVEFLTTGTPVIYNNYSTISEFIEKYRAGWTVSPGDSNSLRSVFTELSQGGPALVETLSANAKRLAANEFAPEKSMAEFLQVCDSPMPKRGANRAPVLVNGKHSPLIDRVLAISPDSQLGPLAEIRVNNPLRSLQRQGLIGSFTFSNVRFQNLMNDDQLYDAVLIQRAIPEYMYHVLRSCGIPFLQDVDDNLLARASYRTHRTEPEVIEGFRHCTALSMTTPRGVRMLEGYSGVPLAHKTFIVPNALPFPPVHSNWAASQPSQIIWIQGDTAALTESGQAVTRAVDRFSIKHQLPVILIGNNVLGQLKLKNQVMMGQIDFSALLQFMESAPTSIGIAPLETNTDQETLDFVSSKSDLKMLYFGGYGHPAVYSASPPYTNSDLQDCGSVVNNSEQEWFDALEYQLFEGWRTIGEHMHKIRSRRHIDRIAAESWAPALRQCKLSKPVRGRDLYHSLTTHIQMGEDPASAVAYLMGNEDVAVNFLSDLSTTAIEHYERHGRAENRPLRHDTEAHKRMLARVDSEASDLFQRNASRFLELRDSAMQIASLRNQVAVLTNEINSIRNSYSWKATALLRTIAKPIMERPKDS